MLLAVPISGVMGGCTLTGMIALALVFMDGQLRTWHADAVARAVHRINLTHADDERWGRLDSSRSRLVMCSMRADANRLSEACNNQSNGDDYED